MENGIFDSVKRFFSPKEEVYNHWYAPVDNFEFATVDFYQMIEKALTERKVPGLEISRVEFKEGGLLSSKREYLRLKRERLVFDICAAPFGTSYFFSFRFVELPLGIKPLQLLIFLCGLLFLGSLLTELFGAVGGVVAFAAIVVAGIWFLRNTVRLGFKDLDATLLKTRIVGPVYELFLRKETYYRQDTRLMYLSTVDSITKALVDDVTAAKGIKRVKRFQRRSGSSDLYVESALSTEDKLAPEVKAP